MTSDASRVAEGVPRPDSARNRFLPALLGAGHGHVSVVWQVSDSISGPNSGFPPATRVEVASFDGTRWSTPEVIIRGRNLSVETLPAMRPTGALDVVAAIANDSAGMVIRIAWLRSGKWSTVDWRSRWSQQGVSWEQPILLDSIHAGYTFFSSARLGGDSLVVVRSRSMKDGEHGGAMMTALSSDGGRNWKQLAPLFVGTEATPRLVVDTKGRLHVFFRGASLPGISNSPGTVMHSVWHSGEWTMPSAVSRNVSFTDPAAGVAAGGQLMATWAEAGFSPLGVQPKTFASLWTAGCR